MTDPEQGRAADRTAPLGALALAAASLRLLARHFGVLFPLAFLPSLALALANSWLGLSETGVDPAAGPDGRQAVAVIVALALNIVAGFLVTGVMCLAALDGALGARHSLGAYVGQTLRHGPAVVAIGTLLSIATALGIVLLVLPGLYVAARWLPWAQTTLFEDLGWGGAGRAQQLTEGRRWPLMAAILVMALVVAVLILVSGPVFVLLADQPILAAVVEAAATAIYYGIVAAFTACAYLRLRELGEGMDAAAIAATLD